jgi:hypothetical protein
MYLVIKKGNLSVPFLIINLIVDLIKKLNKINELSH